MSLIYFNPELDKILYESEKFLVGIDKDEIRYFCKSNSFNRENEFNSVKTVYENEDIICFYASNNFELLSEHPIEGIKNIIEETLEHTKKHKEIFDRTTQEHSKNKIDFINLW